MQIQDVNLDTTGVVDFGRQESCVVIWGGLTWVLLVGLALGDGRVVAGEDAGDKLWSFLEKHETTTLITE